MCSLLDQLPERKEIQLGSVQPYTAGPAELSVQDPVEEVSCTLISEYLGVAFCVCPLHTLALVPLIIQYALIICPFGNSC